MQIVTRIIGCTLHCANPDIINFQSCLLLCCKHCLYMYFPFVCRVTETLTSSQKVASRVAQYNLFCCRWAFTTFCKCWEVLGSVLVIAMTLCPLKRIIRSPLPTTTSVNRGAQEGPCPPPKKKYDKQYRIFIFKRSVPAGCANINHNLVDPNSCFFCNKKTQAIGIHREASHRGPIHRGPSHRRPSQ